MGRRLQLPRRAGAAVTALFDEHGAFVWRTLRHLGVHDAAIDDAVQDVFVTAFRRLDTFEGRSTERTWLFGITRRIAFRYRRAAAARQQRIVPAAGAQHEGAVEPHRRADAQHSIAALVGALERDKRTVFVLCELEGMTAAEVADALSIPLGTVHSRRRAAWQRLVAAAEGDRAALRRAMAGLRAERPDVERHDRVRAALVATVAGSAAKSTTAVAVGVAVVAGLVTVGVVGAPSAAPTRRSAPTEAAPVVSTPPTAETVRPHRAAPAAAVPEPEPVPPVPAVPRKPQRTRPTPEPLPDVLAAELALVTAGKRSLREKRVGDAVRILGEHERTYATGQLASERDALLVDALCRLGDAKRARTVAQRLPAPPDERCW